MSFPQGCWINTKLAKKGTKVNGLYFEKDG
jgi:hypothetical protein